MRFLSTDIPEVILIEPEVHRDRRGFFLESFHARNYAENGLPAAFVQDNHSRSGYGTLRGLHAQSRRPQGKLVRVIEGQIYDVAVDIRRGSPTFTRWVGLTLSAENFRQLYVPVGFAHGFCVLSDEAQVEYKCTDYYDPLGEITIRWDDPEIAIAWPISDPVLSVKDSSAALLRDLFTTLPLFREEA